MAKRISKIIKLNLAAGKATPAPPVGTVLGPAGINMMEFLKKFNEMSSSQMGFVLPTEITIYEDRSFTFIVKQPLATELLKRAANLSKGSSNPSKESAGTISKDKLQEVAKQKMADLNTTDVEMAMRILAGTARSIGLQVEE